MYPKTLPGASPNKHQEESKAQRPKTGFNGLLDIPDDDEKAGTALQEQPKATTLVQENPETATPVPDKTETLAPIQEKPEAAVPANTGIALSTSSAPRKAHRNKKLKVPSRRKINASDDTKKPRLQIYLNEDEKRLVDVYCAYTGASRTDLGADSILDRIYNTYACQNPACGCRFTMHTYSLGDEAPTPIRCPVCDQYTRISPLKPF